VLITHHAQKTIDELLSMFKHGRLNLAPAFQRQSVWGSRDRQLLIHSILEGIPLPTIYLYRQIGPGGVPKYDVIDGKQRIETLLLFLGKGPLAIDHELWVRTSFEDDAPFEWWSWPDLSKEVKGEFLTTKIATIEVEGDLGDIIDLFVRINATGKRLTGQEKRNARYFASPVLRTAQGLANEHRDLFVRQRVLSPSQVQRMKHIELMTELLLAVNAGQPLNKKLKIDEIIRGASPSHSDLKEAAASVRRAMGFVEAVLPDLRTTRFRNGSDFYTLALLMHRMWEEGKTITSHASTRNALAGALLREFGRNVDEAIEHMSVGKGLRSHQAPFRDYIGTVRADTDSFKTRMLRERLLRQVLDHVFEDKDATRLFNPTQRRIVWHTSVSKTCCFCGEVVARWEDMAVDHVKPHSKGGRTQLANAAIAHRRCNSAAGAKRKPNVR
jgi:hypothetical protein